MAEKRLGEDDSTFEEEMVDRIDNLRVDERLTDWEIDFLDSLYQQVLDKKRLTNTQLEKLDEIESEIGDRDN